MSGTKRLTPLRLMKTKTYPLPVLPYLEKITLQDVEFYSWTDLWIFLEAFPSVQQLSLRNLSMTKTTTLNILDRENMFIPKHLSNIQVETSAGKSDFMATETLLHAIQASTQFPKPTLSVRLLWESYDNAYGLHRRPGFNELVSLKYPISELCIDIHDSEPGTCILL
ncbi:hypothetical protein ABKN59_003493 [Abortiporus biennis]